MAGQKAANNLIVVSANYLHFEPMAISSLVFVCFFSGLYSNSKLLLSCCVWVIQFLHIHYSSLSHGLIPLDTDQQKLTMVEDDPKLKERTTASEVLREE